MLEASFIPLPLSDIDGLVKVVIGVAFALIWIVAQVASSISAGKKKQEAQRRRMGLDLPQSGGTLLPLAPPHAQSRPPDASKPRYVPRAAPQPMPREVPQHMRGQMQQWAALQPQRPAVQQTSTPRSYEELRQLKQQQQQPTRRQPDQRKRKRSAIQPPSRTEVVAPAVGATLASRATRAAARPRGAAGDITAGEIGGAPMGLTSTASRAQLRERVRGLLTPRSVREVILASELLRPPLALRENPGTT